MVVVAADAAAAAGGAEFSDEENPYEVFDAEMSKASIFLIRLLDLTCDFVLLGC